MAMDKRLLGILCCPVTHKGLSRAGNELLRKVNSAIAAGTLQNRDGDTLSDTFEEALVTDDDRLLYPVDDGIPVLLEGQSVMLEQIENA